MQRVERAIRKHIGPDTEHYSWFLVTMLTNPKLVYETSKYQHGLTHQWHRRDNAIDKAVLCITFILSVVYGMTFVRPLFFLPFVVVNWCLSFVFGVVISLVLYNACRVSFTTGDVFTIRYSFDVHINSYFVYLVTTHIILFVLSPLLFAPSVVATICSNLIMFIGTCQYLYSTHLGYSILPFFELPKAPLFFCVGFAAFFFLLMTLLGINVALFLL